MSGLAIGDLRTHRTEELSPAPQRDSDWRCLPTPVGPRRYGRQGADMNRLVILALSAAMFFPIDLTAPLAALRMASQSSPAVRYSWPLPEPVTVQRPFDDPARPWLAGHRGADLAGSSGQQVLAAADGVVAFAGTVVDRGVVSLDHADGIRTTYEPLAPLVTTGQVVERGEPIGVLQAGHGGGWDLHWGARRAGPDGRPDYIDPVALVQPPVVIRLRPTRLVTVQ